MSIDFLMSSNVLGKSPKILSISPLSKPMSFMSLNTSKPLNDFSTSDFAFSSAFAFFSMSYSSMSSAYTFKASPRLDSSLYCLPRAFIFSAIVSPSGTIIDASLYIPAFLSLSASPSKVFAFAVSASYSLRYLLYSSLSSLYACILSCMRSRCSFACAVVFFPSS